MMFEVRPWVCGKVNAFPVSSKLSRQPAKVYPVLVGSTGADPICSSVLTVVEVTAVPPLDWKSTVRLTASHLA